ncbi:rhodanese-like domain-containing protein [Chloroflexota bacterium]
MRTWGEFIEGYIESTINIDFYSKAFRDMFNNLDNNKTRLTYCRVGGCGGSAVDITAERNSKGVRDILGGIN